MLPRICAGSRLLRLKTTAALRLSAGRPNECHIHTAPRVLNEDVRVEGVNKCPHDCLCSHNITFDYKNARLLSQFVSNQTGLIIPRTITKICMKKQKEMAKAIKRARVSGFMPFIEKIPEYLRDPKLF